tara:strand:- start:25 stop:1368 length:1344 start_codon:yes stop_codon:yes gene_type:complete
MKFSNFLKSKLKKIPINISIGKYISMLPYEYRLGVAKSYTNSKKELYFYQKSSNEEKKYFIFKKFKKLVTHAYNNIPFYRNYYNENNFNINQFKNYDDIKKIPIVNKKILRSVKLNERSIYEFGAVKSNTGGTSGAPLDLYTPSIALGHELAHLEFIWSHINFKKTDLRLILVGRSDVKNYVEYDFLRHALVVDIYADHNLIFKKLDYFLKKSNIRYLHGYPSAIYDFCCKLFSLNQSLYFKIKETLIGVIYNSEYPQEHMRNYIEKDIFNIKSQAFYGHTERCVLAYENSDEYYRYKAIQTYGYCEVAENNLIGTSYNNFASPLIRYDTEDQVNETIYKQNILESFYMNNGRNSDYILDFKHKKIPLTGLIFGRHHSLFNYCDYIQIFQKNIGYATILYVLKKPISGFEPSSHFDESNIDMQFDYQEINKPIKTKNGKNLLLVKKM